MLKINSILLVGLLIISGLAGLTGFFDNIVEATGPTNSSWSMFRHDLQHSGYSTSEAPDTNNVIWEYATFGWVRSSPAVADGKVYIGSIGDTVFCLDADTRN